MLFTRGRRGRRTPGADVDPPRSVLRAGLAFGGAACAPVALAGLTDDLFSAVGVMIGGAMGLGAMAVPAVLYAQWRRGEPAGQMLSILAAYAVVVVFLGSIGTLLSLLEAVPTPWVGAGLLTSTAASTVSQVRAVARLRIPLPGDPGDGGAEDTEAPSVGSPESQADGSG